jgi:hypothetical protein
MGEPYTSAGVRTCMARVVFARGWFFEGKICDLCKVVVYLQAKR